MHTSVGGIFGYHIRHETTLGPHTRVMLGTDGIFLRDVENDMLLRYYSDTIIVEVHRSFLNTDYLL